MNEVIVFDVPQEVEFRSSGKYPFSGTLDTLSQRIPAWPIHFHREEGRLGSDDKPSLDPLLHGVLSQPERGRFQP